MTHYRIHCGWAAFNEALSECTVSEEHPSGRWEAETDAHGNQHYLEHKVWGAHADPEHPLASRYPKRGEPCRRVHTVPKDEIKIKDRWPKLKEVIGALIYIDPVLGEVSAREIRFVVDWHGQPVVEVDVE